MKSVMLRYFIAVIPREDISEQARKWQLELAETYGTKASLRSPPHITLHMPFLWKETREEELIRQLTNHFGRQSSFRLGLDGIGAFPPRVIYINVVANDSIVTCQKALTRFCKINFDIHNSDYAGMPYHPHLTLAFRDLRKSDFQKAWEEFQNRQFRAEFEVSRITLLKHTGKEWLAHHEMQMR